MTACHLFGTQTLIWTDAGLLPIQLLGTIVSKKYIKHQWLNPGLNGGLAYSSFMAGHEWIIIFHRKYSMWLLIFAIMSWKYVSKLFILKLTTVPLTCTTTFDDTACTTWRDRRHFTWLPFIRSCRSSIIARSIHSQEISLSSIYCFVDEILHCSLYFFSLLRVPVQQMISERYFTHSWSVVVVIRIPCRETTIGEHNDKQSALAQVMPWCYQETSHYISQYSHIALLGHEE